MKVVHLVEDSDGTSHFADAEIRCDLVDFAPPAPPIPVSAAESCQRYLFVQLPGDWSGARHPSPRRQVAFCLAGRLRIEAGDGEHRVIGAGDVWRMEDVSGTGHTTSVVGGEPVSIAIVQLE